MAINVNTKELKTLLESTPPGHNISIGLKTAEQIKFSVGSVLTELPLSPAELVSP